MLLLVFLVIYGDVVVLVIFLHHENVHDFQPRVDPGGDSQMIQYAHVSRCNGSSLGLEAHLSSPGLLDDVL